MLHPVPLSVFLALCLIVTPRCHAQNQRVTVRTPLGNVTGLVTVVEDRNVNQFLGIPYAEPPLNELRFRKPVAVQAWSNALDATEFGFSCPQPGLNRGTREDCLFLNIYVTANDSLSRPGLKPVMIWIHGGSFKKRSGSETDGSLLAVRGDVVVVTINYRLGMLGWLSTLDQASPGNYGLWDQKMAIHFVRDNIAAFGGDPNQITIFGQSAGGYSIGLHTVSPLNNGLFQRAIMQSGAALNRRTIALDPLGFAQRFAANLSCLREPGKTFDSQYLVNCARQRPVNQILQATTNAANRSFVAWILDVAPVVDGELIPADVRTLLGPQYRQRIPFWNMDVMVGTTNAEGSLALSPLVPFQRELGFNLEGGIPTRVLCRNITTALARDYFGGSRAVSDELCRRYTSTRGDADQARQVVSLYTDMMYVSAAVETLALHANATGTQRGHFQYLFSHAPRTGGVTERYPWFRGAGHRADVNYVFGISMDDEAEARLSSDIMEAWSNFAKFGTPNNRRNPGTFWWPAYDVVNKSFTNLDLVLSVQNHIYAQRTDFWLQTVPNMAANLVSSTPRPRLNVTDRVTGSPTRGAERGNNPSGNGATSFQLLGLRQCCCIVVLSLLSVVFRRSFVV